MTTYFRLLLAGVAGLLLATSCVNTERESSVPARASRIAASPITQATAPSRTTYVPPSGRGQRVASTTVLNTVRASHVFSNAQAPDDFVLQLRGARVLTGQLYLSVVSAQGDTLRREVLPARVLQDPQAITVRDQEISVLRGMNTFFGPSHFSMSASSSEAPDVAFSYPTATGLRRLGYSPRQGRAVVLAE